MSSLYFGVPWALNGDTTIVPQALQGDGSVSFDEGWSIDYTLEQGVAPAAKDIPRQQENYFKNVVTEALKEIQEIGFKVYDALVNYPVNGITPGLDGILYKCLIANGPLSLPVVDPVGDLTSTWEPLLTPEHDLSADGYFVYPEDENQERWVAQWGQDSTSGGVKAISYPISFDVVFFAGTFDQMLGTTPAYQGAKDVLVDGFTCYSIEPADAFFWIAVGKLT